jgi:endonuclease/exonuclease/phosphatase family metal-dependent hydrolase
MLLRTTNSSGGGSVARESGVRTVKVCTWNISAGRRSDEAPTSWVLADQEAAVIQEILKWGCDVVALQEVITKEPLQCLLERYKSVGASRSTNRNLLVHLYSAKDLDTFEAQCDVEGVMTCKMRYPVFGEDSGPVMCLAAVHLPSGLSNEAIRSRALESLARDAVSGGLLIFGDTNCKDDEAEAVCNVGGLKEACYTGSSWDVRGNKFDASCEYGEFGLRYDRMFMSGSVWAETFVVFSRCKTFYEGQMFFLSDHYPVIGVVDCHDVFNGSRRAAETMARVRGASLVQLRNFLSQEERLAGNEWMKQGREEKAFVSQQVAEEKRVAIWRAQRAALAKRRRSRERRLKLAFGERSVWEGKIEEVAPRALATVNLDGWTEEVPSREIPSHVFLRGIASGQNDPIMPCLLQVLLRLPAMSDWMFQHTEHCSNSRACAMCWIKVARDAISAGLGQRSIRVDVVPPGVDSRDLQDASVLLERLLRAIINTEVSAGRVGNFVAFGDPLTVTHVERLFGSLLQIWSRCASCHKVAIVDSLSSFLILPLSVKVSGGAPVTVTELYVDSCHSQSKEISCDFCGALHTHDVASRIASTPEVLILSLETGAQGSMISVDVEEELFLPGLASLRLVSAVYRARHRDGSACYSCACRGPMDAWWYFEEGRAPEPIQGFISHLKRKHVCILSYERCVIRGRSAKRKAHVACGKDTKEVKRHCPQVVVPTGVQPPVSGRHCEWPFPKRTLKSTQALFKVLSC